MQNLSDFLNSNQATIKLKNAPNFEFKIRALTLHDDAWIESEFDSDDLKAAMNIKGWGQLTGSKEDKEKKKKYQDILLRVFFRTLDAESKAFVCAVKIESEPDEFGNITPVENMSGPQKLERLISSSIEFLQMINAIAFARDMANPLMSEILTRASENKTEGTEGKKSHGKKSTTK